MGDVMKILIIADSFKGTLSSTQANTVISKAILDTNHTHEILTFPIADGGEGSLSVFKHIYPTLELIQETVKGPLQTNVEAYYGIVKELDLAIIESAEACGLSLLSPNQRNPLITTSYGVGELMINALNKGIKNLIITLGGTATNDGGAGMLSALGVTFKPNSNKLYTGNNLNEIESIDFSTIHPLFNAQNITVLCDVTNPLLGNLGATHIYSHQKGAKINQIEPLEANMTTYASVVENAIDCNIKTTPGSGAAGGLGFAFKALGATLKTGIDYLLTETNLEEIIKASDLIITGEGKLDSQTLSGKTLKGISSLALKYQIPCIVYVGSIEGHPNDYKELGLTSIYSLSKTPKELNNILKDPEKALFDCVKATFSQKKNR